jgi:hypothetical protein
MQSKKPKAWSRKTKKIFATDILKGLRDIADKSAEEQEFEPNKRGDEDISAKVKEYTRMTAFYERNPDSGIENRVLGRLRAEVIKLIIRGRRITKLNLALMNLTNYDVAFEKAYYNGLRDWIKEKYRTSDEVKKGLRSVASTGKQISYKKLEQLKTDLKEAEEYEIKMIEVSDKPDPNALHRGEKMMTDEIILTARELATQTRINLEKMLEAEGWRCSAEKSEPANLCFFVLYDLMTVYRQDVLDWAEVEGYTPSLDNLNDVHTIKAEIETNVLYRIDSLSKHNMEILVNIICKNFNDPIKDDLANDFKIRRNGDRRKKEYTSSEKIKIIQKHQTKGLTQYAVVKKTGFSISTVKRAWI